MSDDMVMYEVGIRNTGERFVSFLVSEDLNDVNEYIETMKLALPEEIEIVFLTKRYRCISTIPHMVSR